MPLEAGLLLRDMARKLREAGVDTAMLDARLILKHVMGLTDVDLIARSNMAVSDDLRDDVERLIVQRIQGKPVSRILGCKEFFGRSFDVSPATLDPRPDTEILVEAALEAVSGTLSPKILDLGTGTGALVITLLAERQDASGWATDVSGDALLTAQKNAEVHGVSDRLQLTCGSWFEGVTGAFDLVVSNPPYIPAAELPSLAREVRDHDPLLALDGGVDGLKPFREIFSASTRFLRPGGHLIVEFGMGQQDAVQEIAARHGLILDAGQNALRCDLAGIIRCAHFRYLQ